MSTLIIGVTGGIGSGKSEVTRRFQALGIDVVDADEMSRVVVEPGKPALTDIAQHFGSDILTTKGELDRAALRELIFKKPDERLWLENLLHPLINREIRKRLAAATSPYAILASPLLLETQQHQLVDRILIVDTPEEQQLARASRRDGNVEQIKAIMATQISRPERLARGQDVIDNSGELNALDAQVARLHEQYNQLAND